MANKHTKFSLGIDDKIKETLDKIVTVENLSRKKIFGLSLYLETLNNEGSNSSTIDRQNIIEKCIKSLKFNGSESITL
ncbi:MAG: hypothetical protein ACK4YV_12645 [Emticicia sp.]